MSGATFELILLSVLILISGIGAVVSALCLLRTRSQTSTLTEQSAGRILRSETDIVRARSRRRLVVCGRSLDAH